MAEERSLVRTLGTGCLVLVLLILCCGGCFGGLYAGMAVVFEKSDPYKHAVALAEADTEVQELIGSPVEPVCCVRGWVGMGDGASADLQIPMKGEVGTGTVYVEATLDGNDWTYTRISFLRDLTAESVNLLGNVGEAPEDKAADERSDRLSRARALYRQGKYDDAIDIYDALLDDDPKNVDAMFGRAQCNHDAGRTSAAERDLMKALKIDDDHAASNKLLGIIYYESERWKPCIETLTNYLKAESGDGTGWYYRARCYEENGQLRQARGGAREACDRGLKEGCDMVRRIDR